MKVLSEKELRKICESEEFEGVDIKWDNGSQEYIGRLLFDYDMGFSILVKYDSDHCITGIDGPEYAKLPTNYTTKETYHKDLTVSFQMLRDGVYNIDRFNTETDTTCDLFGGLASCPIT